MTVLTPTFLEPVHASYQPAKLASFGDDSNHLKTLPAWGISIQFIGGASKIEAEAATPEPAVTYAERMADAVRALRRRIDDKFGNRVINTRISRNRFENEGDDEVEILNLIAEISDADSDECNRVSDELVEFIICHPDQDVQQDLTVEIFCSNG